MASDNSTPTAFIPLGVAVLTVSDTRTLRTDTSGAAVVEGLQAAGHELVARKLLADDRAALTEQFRQWVQSDAIRVVIATGGTGVTQRDVTPEALEPLISKTIPGFGELFRSLSFAEIGASTIQSRAMAAICERTLVFLLPGSTRAVRLAMEKIILPQLDARTKPCNFATLLPRM